MDELDRLFYSLNIFDHTGYEEIRPLGKLPFRRRSVLSFARLFDPPIALPNFDFMNALPRQQLGGCGTRVAVTPMFYGHGAHDAAVSAAE